MLQLVEQNTSLKRDVALAEKRLLARNDRIQNLETLLQDSQDKLNSANARFDLQMQAVQEKVARAEALAQKNQLMGGAFSLGSRIARPLRGGSNAPDNASEVKVVEGKRGSWW